MKSNDSPLVILPECFLFRLRFSMILAVLTTAQQGLATSNSMTLDESGARQVEGARDLSGPARVRLGLKLKPYQTVTLKRADHKSKIRFVPVKEVKRTLRARINKPNHFFVGDYHIETEPLKWIRKTRKYWVRLKIYKRYGAFGQLEENLGSVDLAGVLVEQADGVFVLHGAARKRFRNKFGHPVLDVVAGFRPRPQEDVAVSKSMVPRQPAPPRQVPKNSSKALIRGRF